MTEKVFITDVGPRDGLQNQSTILTVEQRLKLIRAIEGAGVQQIEVGSFVSPKAVPAMDCTDQVVAGLEANKTMRHTVLIPNMRGYERAREAGAKSVNMVIYASESMAQKNINMSMGEAEQVAVDIIRQAKQDHIGVIVILAVTFECPFDGERNPENIVPIVGKFVEMDVPQVVLADTIGAANPLQVRSLTSDLVSQFGSSSLACHFHDTRAMGLANVYAAVASGIRHFDASIAGLGGCPFAPGASGNVATEDVVMLLEQMGFDTGIDISLLLKASDLAAELTESSAGGRAKTWLEGYMAKQADQMSKV